MLKRKQTRVLISTWWVNWGNVVLHDVYSWYGYKYFLPVILAVRRNTVHWKSNKISTYQYYFNMMECQASLQMPLECSCWVIYGIPKNPICVHYTVGNNYNGFNGHILFNFKHAKQRAFLLVQNATKDNKRKWQQLFTSITKIRLWYSVYFKCSDVKTKDQ